MKRREFITLLGGAAAWPLAASAQQPAMPVIGFLGSATAEAFKNRVLAFRRGLSDTGYVEGRNVAIEYRWAGNDSDRLPALAADLVQRRVAVIATAAGSVTALAAKSASATNPIVFFLGSDPVRVGLVASLNRPGGNITGVTVISQELMAKRLEISHKLAPAAADIGWLSNPKSVNPAGDAGDLEAAGKALGRRVVTVNAGSDGELDAAFAALAGLHVGALIVGPDPLFNSRNDEITALAARYAIPSIYEFSESVTAGGLISYGPNLIDQYRQVGIYVGRVLKGEKPLDLPVMQPTKFELVINLKTARALGLTVPPSLLAIADEVIE
jgi:putative ABC transport system substrate-binding protein